MMQDKQAVTLAVRFDVDQDGTGLDWRLYETNGDARPNSGPYTGAVHFHQGESVRLEVTATGNPGSDFTSFQILDCCLITLPQVVLREPGQLPRFAQPSPFLQSVGASYQFDSDFNSSEVRGDGLTPRSVTQHWKRTLNIAYNSGRWEMSFNITVKILRARGRPPEVRVFQFDPETQVGDGTHPGSGARPAQRGRDSIESFSGVRP